MKYLKVYKLFESADKEDIKDILLELRDIGCVVNIHDLENSNDLTVIFMGYKKGLPWDMLRDYALRVKDCLGSQYYSFTYTELFDSTDRGFLMGPINAVLNEDTKIERKITSFAIKYRNKNLDLYENKLIHNRQEDTLSLNSKEVSSLFTPIIDWDLIADAKDMSLEYLDNNMILIICIKMNYPTLYLERFSHQEDTIRWSPIQLMIDIYQINKNNLVYIFQLTTDDEKSRYYAGVIPDETKELVDRIKESYPNYNYYMKRL